ncbi:MAG: hypothetical protein RJA05_443 [Planctomycetota bacterium]|jgi:hypothetical protein
MGIDRLIHEQALKDREERRRYETTHRPYELVQPPPEEGDERRRHPTTHRPSRQPPGSRAKATVFIILAVAALILMGLAFA